MSWSLVLCAFLTLLLLLSGTGLYAVNHSQESIEQFTNVNVNQQSTLNRTNSSIQNVRLQMGRLYEELLEAYPSLTDVERRQRADEMRHLLENADNVFAEFLALPFNPSHEHFVREIDSSCRVPDDHMSYRSYPLLAARELLKQCIREQVYGHQTA
jgi:hypothetical protein